MTTVVPLISLQSFYIFNSSLCEKEGEEEKKILFYHPFSVDLDSKIRSIGLVEAVIKFTETFNSNESCNSLHTQKTRQVYLEPEKNFWMVMTLTVPNASKTKDTMIYQGDDVQDNVYISVLRAAYSMFRLLKGTFKEILAKENVEVLKHAFNVFFPKYLLSLKLEHCDILNILNGIHYLPLNKVIFLDVVCFMNQINADFPSAKYTAFMYKDSLIWTGIEPIDFQPIYSYLVNNVLPTNIDTESTQGNETASTLLSSGGGFFSQSTQQQQHYCRYLNIKTAFDKVDENAERSKTIPKIYLYVGNKKDCELYLVVYRGFNSSIVLLFDAEIDSNYLKTLDAFMEPNLTKLASEIAESCNKQDTMLSDSPRYVVFNSMNLAYKSTVHLDNKQSGNITISHDALKIIADIKADQPKETYFGETVVKTLEDDWVIGKFSHKREFYAAIHHKNANLIEINEEIKKLCDAELTGIFFQT